VKEEQTKTTPITIPIPLELTDTHAWAFAQFLKRLRLDQIRDNAIDEVEAGDIQTAANATRKALAAAGYDPR
jgi:hypothetical protein